MGGRRAHREPDPGGDAERRQHRGARGDPAGRAGRLLLHDARGHGDPPNASLYQLLPPRGTGPLVDAAGVVQQDDVQDAAIWEKYGWGPFSPAAPGAGEVDRAFVRAALERARAFHDALARPSAVPCPVPVYVLGGDCLLTAARAVAPSGPRGSAPRFEARTGAEQDLLFEPGDGRVTRSSLLGAHLPGAETCDSGGYCETTRVFFGSADHHGLYADPAFQSLLLRLLQRTAPAAVAASAARGRGRDGGSEVTYIRAE